MVLSAGVIFERPTISVGCADEGAVVSISRVKCTPRSSEVSAVCKRYLYSCLNFFRSRQKGTPRLQLTRFRSGRYVMCVCTSLWFGSSDNLWSSIP